jgi:hypothetical protein
MEQITNILIDFTKIFLILAITTGTFYFHPLISSIIILIYEILYNVKLITLSHIDIPPNFAFHIIKLCTLIVIEFIVYMTFGPYILLTFTMIKINYIFVKTSLAEMIYGKNCESEYEFHNAYDF